MTVIVDPCEASPELLAPLANLISERAPMSSEVGEYYDIDYVQKSESAWILFAHKEGREGERYVIKLLCSYDDQRYHLESLARRQGCQLEALARNSIFSPAIYVGLASSYRLQPEQKRIVLGQPTYDTTQLNPQTEYALVMRQLSSESRLDFLLEHADESKLEQLMHHLVERIIAVHNASPALPLKEAQKWGNFPKIRKKLEHNLSLADPLFEPAYHNALLYQDLRKRFADLKINLQQIFALYPYKIYFEQRVNQGYIKHCHGDLKGPNIWVEQLDPIERNNVAILDAIDFNPMYSNIDTLSDFATLVVDILTRLRCTAFARRLAQQMIDWYLEETSQFKDKDKVALPVLHYYLVEKAFVGAAISIVYDDLPELGGYFLQVAETCWEDYFAQRLAALKPATPEAEQNTVLSR